MEVLPESPIKRDLTVLAPKDYFVGPVFAASKQTGPRQVTIRVNTANGPVERRYEIGGFHPLRRNLSPPALDVRHGRAIFTLLSFRKPYEEDGSRMVRFSFNDFCRRYARSNGGRYMRDIQQILADLLDAYIRVTDTSTGASHTYRLIEHIDIENRPIRRRDAKLANDFQTEIWFNGCRLSPEFFGLLDRIAELQSLNLQVFTKIRSPLAQAIYLYIPSRADHHSEESPFEITLTTLLNQVSFRVPPQKQRRHQIFTQHEDEGRSIMQQLDGLETLKGVFRVRLTETTDGRDWKLLCWVEHRKKELVSNPSESKLVNAYLASGRPRELLPQILGNVKPLDDYELDLLTLGKVDYLKSRRMFELAKAFLGEAKFRGLLAEAKADEQEGRRATKNPTARLIHRIMEAMGAPTREKRR